jgi:hypothetical protein
MVVGDVGDEETDGMAESGDEMDEEAVKRDDERTRSLRSSLVRTSARLREETSSAPLIATDVRGRRGGGGILARSIDAVEGKQMRLVGPTYTTVQRPTPDQVKGTPTSHWA